jgi:pimeloyl-ACP methyl ester carboxylesterase
MTRSPAILRRIPISAPDTGELFNTDDVQAILEDASDVRAVAGNSMGGLSTLKFAENHPGMFKAAASFSGNVDPLHGYSGGSDGFDKPGLACWADWPLPGQRVLDRPDGLSPAGEITQVSLEEPQPLQDYGCFLPDDPFALPSRRG